MEDNFNQIAQLFQEMEIDFEKHSEKGNSSAGTRVRKNALQISKLLKVLRKDVQENINSMKAK